MDATKSAPQPHTARVCTDFITLIFYEFYPCVLKCCSFCFVLSQCNLKSNSMYHLVFLVYLIMSFSITLICSFFNLHKSFGIMRLWLRLPCVAIGVQHEIFKILFGFPYEVLRADCIWVYLKAHLVVSALAMLIFARQYACSLSYSSVLGNPSSRSHWISGTVHTGPCRTRRYQTNHHPQREGTRPWGWRPYPPRNWTRS